MQAIYAHGGELVNGFDIMRIYQHTDCRSLRMDATSFALDNGADSL